MTLVDIYNNIKSSALSKVGVESVYLEEPYECWNVYRNIKYGSVAVYIDSVVTGGIENSRNYNVSLYYADILTETADNLFSVQNTAVEVLTAIIKDLRGNEGCFIDNNTTVTLFKQKFTDLLGGGYCTFSLSVIVDDCDKLNK